MATHGFIEFNYENEKQTDRTLVHAVHDGYPLEILSDIITLPFYIVNRFRESDICYGNIPEFLKKYNKNTTQYMYKNFSNKFNSYEDALFMWESIIPLDESRYSSISYLIAKQPDKYQVENEPYVLYGNILENTDISISFKNRRLNTAIITHDIDSTDRILNLINDVNVFIVNDDNKIIILDNGKKIIMNFDKMVLDLIFHKKY